LDCAEGVDAPGYAALEERGYQADEAEETPVLGGGVGEEVGAEEGEGEFETGEEEDEEEVREGEGV